MAHIDPPIPDLVAFSGQRDYTVLEAGFTRAELTLGIVESMVRAGWTIQSGPTAQSFGNGYTLISRQSPWYDHDNIPSWYLGNRVLLTIDNNGSSADVRFRVGVDYNTVTELQMTAAEFFFLRVSEIDDFNFHILSNPYQMLYWTADDPGAGLSTQEGDMQRRSFLVSAVNLPKPILQKNKIIHCVFATSRLRGYNEGLGGAANGSDYSCYRIVDLVGQYTAGTLGANGLRFLSPAGGVSPNTKTARRIWNRELDPTMTDENAWSAFFTSPSMIWKLPQISTTTINGYLWDAICLSEGFRLQSTIELAERNWMMYAGTNKLAFNQAGSSLFMNIDLNLPV